MRGAPAPYRSTCTPPWWVYQIYRVAFTAQLGRLLFFLLFERTPILALRDALIDVLEECTNLLMSEERRGGVYFPASCIKLNGLLQENLVTPITGNGQEI